jgi:hypothetical protein
MNQRLKLAGRIVIVVIWLFFISLPLFAFLLAARQEIKIGSSTNHLRFFLVSEKEAEGIGIEVSRLLSSVPACTQTSVGYLMWLGEPDNVTYCECMDPQTGFALPAGQDLCRPP